MHMCPSLAAEKIKLVLISLSDLRDYVGFPLHN
jgi:hypothetical protein